MTGDVTTHTPLSHTLHPFHKMRSWNEAADLIIKGMDGAIMARTVTYDFHRLLQNEGGATKVKCSEFADAIIKHMA